MTAWAQVLLYTVYQIFLEQGCTSTQSVRQELCVHAISRFQTDSEILEIFVLFFLLFFDFLWLFYVLTGCLSALVYQHAITPLALPCKLLIPTTGLWKHHAVTFWSHSHHFDHIIPIKRSIQWPLSKWQTMNGYNLSVRPFKSVYHRHEIKMGDM